MTNSTPIQFLIVPYSQLQTSLMHCFLMLCLCFFAEANFALENDPEVIDKAALSLPNHEQIILGSYTELSRAQAALALVRRQTELPLEITRNKSKGRTLFRLTAGPFSSKNEAERILQIVRQHTPDAWIDRKSAETQAGTTAIVLGSFIFEEAAYDFIASVQAGVHQKLKVIDARLSHRTLFRVITTPSQDIATVEANFQALRDQHPNAWMLRGDASDLEDQVQTKTTMIADKPVTTSNETLSNALGERVQLPADIHPAANNENKVNTPTKTVVVDSRTPTKARSPSNWVPPGFEELLEPQTTQIDVYFGRVFLTSTLATYTPTEITLLTPQAVISELSDALEPELLLVQLSGPLPTNTDLVCLYENQTDCGSLEPDRVDVIFDESRFRLDLFIHRELLAVRDVNIDRFLPASSSGLAFLNQFNATMNGAEGSDSVYNIGNSTTLAYRETRLLAIHNFTKDEDFTVDTLAIERELNGQLYQAGYFRSSAADLRFITEREFAGITMSSSLDTRTDLDQSSGNDLQVFLDSRSRVDLLKDGRLMSTAIYEAGNQIVDTSGLPGGAYDVVIRIRDSFGRTQDDIRFYVKTSQLPPIDQTIYFLDVGEVAFREQDESLPQTNGDSLIRAGVSRRFTSNFGGQIGVMAIEDEQILEIGLYQLGRSHELNLNFVAGSNNDRGVNLSARFRWRELTLNTNYRRTWVDENRFDVSLLDQRATQGSVNLTVPIGRGSLSLTGRYNKRGLREADRNIGFRYEFPDYRVGLTSLDTNLQITRDNDDFQALLTFRIRLDRGNWRHELSSQYYHDDLDIAGRDDGIINNLSSAWSDGDRYRSDINWNLRAVNEREDDTVETDIEIVSDYGRMNADAVYSNETDTLSWGASLHTNIIANSDTFSFGGREQARSALVMDVAGEVEDAYFEVLVNGAPRGNARIGGKTVIGIQPYDTYEVSLLPLGDSIVDFNNQVQTATLYPGNVVTMDWKVARVIVAFGQLVDEDGSPVKDALLSNVTGIATTDEYGYFQAEIEAGTRFVDVKTRSLECRATLPGFDTTETVVMLEELVCR